MDWSLDFLFHPRARGQRHVLTPARPLRLRGAIDRQVICRRGCVWITAAGLLEDIFLSAGQRWTISRNGMVLIESDAEVELDG
jgi:hypothetical protein